MFSSLDTIPDRDAKTDRQTDRQTACDDIVRVTRDGEYELN